MPFLLGRQSHVLAVVLAICARARIGLAQRLKEQRVGLLAGFIGGEIESSHRKTVIDCVGLHELEDLMVLAVLGATFCVSSSMHVFVFSYSKPFTNSLRGTGLSSAWQ